ANPEPMIICDEDQDLVSTVNLESVLADLTDNVDDVSFTFYTSFDDAINQFHDFFSISNPSNYVTGSREIFIRAELESENCFTIFSFDIEIYADPQLGNIPDLINCQADDGQPSDFFLGERDAQIIGIQQGMQVLYFESENDAMDRNGPIDATIAYQNTSNPQTIYVRLENQSHNGCFKVAPMQIEVRQSPDYNIPTDVFECDVNLNGLATTDLNDKVAEIQLGSTTDLNISFHLSPLNAEIGANPIPMDYTATGNPQLIYARIENANSGCFNVETFNINTFSLPEINLGQSLVACGNNFQTTLQWDLTEVELEVLDGRQYNIDFTYFTSQAGAEADIDPITDPGTYINTEGQETVFVRVTNLTTGCFSIAPFELVINPAPPINEFEVYRACHNEDGTVDLSDINSVLLENTFNVLVSYHNSIADAEANNSPLDTDHTYTGDTEDLVARVEFSTTGCYAVYPFRLQIDPLPIAHQPDDLVACDDDLDGLLELDLSVQDTAVLNGQEPGEHTIGYFSSQDDARENTNALGPDHVAANNETIFVRLENNETGCFDIAQFSVTINPLPVVDIGDQVICLDDLPLTVSAQTGDALDTYLWSTGETAAEIEITETGSYSVTVTSTFGCQATGTFNVAESEAATIDVVETVDFSDPNNITITISGIGDYLYQLNDLPPQTSNVFNDVPIGYNTVTVIDLNGCARITREVLVVDIPKHMTPNGDGDFDTWHIVGVETLPGTVVHIFDRYGKLLKELRHDSLGWDGTFNGNKMPTGDYWYVADVVHNGERFQIKGHFALRR
ncbi:T9SS type B sorting domain-containing protein, partial [Winogradskyella sp.]|uniref:T9SS type B sorting domain-containing protein n=1 Tax=Winogradskyella sp. TaxID=1883156 RepID=UPI00262B61D6